MREYKNQRNPILPLDIHIPDSEAHRMPDGKLYVYGSFDSKEDGFCSERYYAVSTPDLEHWTIHDVSFTAQDIPWLHAEDSPAYPGIDWYHPTPFLQKMIAQMMEDWEKSGGKAEEQEQKVKDQESDLLFAPDCIYHNGKYYLYFCLSDNREGVATAERPEGPFTNPVQLPCGGIDPAVFVDDDGQAYYYWGQVYSHGVRLNPDMVSFRPEDVVDNLVTEEAHFFHEGSSVRKIEETYYYIFADVERGKPTALGYATGKTPLGPFTYQGIIIDNEECDPASWNNHGSIECIDGQWYVFYHRCSRNTQMHRRLCIEKIHINVDGTINEVKMTSQGTGDPFAPGERIQGYQACGMKGSCYIDVDQEYGFEEKLTNLCDGDEAVFRYVKSGKPWKGIELTCVGSGRVSVFLNGEEAGRTTVSGEKGKVQTVSVPLTMDAGEYELMLRFEKTDGMELMAVTLFSE